jgi:hypothetical protein
MKWRKYKERGNRLVALKEPRLVSRVGYEVDFEEACRMVAREATFVPGDPRIEDAKTELAGWPVRQDKDFDLKIVSLHNSLWKYWDDRANFRKHLKDNLEEAIGHLGIDVVVAAIDHAVVRNMVLDRLRSEVHGGQERKIFFNALPPDQQGWRGPWEVLGWGTAYTGTYYPGSGGRGGEDDYEPPGLAGAKAHVLLRVAYDGRVFGIPGEARMVLKEDTYPWENEAVAQKMLPIEIQVGLGRS